MKKSLSPVVAPEHYDLRVAVAHEGYKGEVKIKAHAQVEVKEFQINSENLDIAGITVNDKEAKWADHKDGFVTVELSEPAKDDIQIAISYSGRFDEQLEGFYRSGPKESPVFSTHFEPADARKAFPCFDQPDMKATFSVTIEVPEGNIALSNSRLASREGNVFVFEKTPRMSTYIVAFVVGNLDYIEAYTGQSEETGDESPKRAKVKDSGAKDGKKGIPIRVYAHPDEKEWGRFALDVAVRCLKFFEEYFEIDYPLPKLDMVAIPAFAMGAMENWGLVTYRNTSLLFDEKSTAMRSKKNIANTVCHELAHMWFGNLVTMEWWNDLWLNEGFATWAATLAISKSQQDILPWDAWTSFINDDIESGMARDSLASTHKIAAEVNNPVEVDQIFDEISYSKGSSIIKMVENWLGSETFRKGLVSYLKEYSYKNTVTKNLWDALSLQLKSDATGDASQSVDAVIDPWVSRDGFPYIQVEDKGETLLLTQKRFTLGYQKEDEPWPIPVKIRWVPSNKISTFVMTEGAVEIKKEDQSYKLNDETSGFYRVLYPQNHLAELIKLDLGTQNRLNLVNDAFALGKGLYAPLPLSFISEMKAEENYEVLSAVLGGLGNLQSVFYDDDERVKYFTRKMEEIISHRVGTIDLSNPGTTINEISVNSLVVSRAVADGNEEIISRLKKAERKDIHAEFLRAYFIANVDDKFDEIYDLYQNSQSPQEKTHALSALGKTKSKEKLQFLFSNLRDIKPHESIYLFASLGGSITLRHHLIDLFIQNFADVRAIVKGASLLRRIIEYVFVHALAPSHKEKSLKFLQSLESHEDLTSALKTCADSITLNSKLRDHYADKAFE